MWLVANPKPKSVTVMGAGVTGVASAWYLSQAGFEVTVIDRQSLPAMETSFANGGQISVCHATPWANPATPKKALAWLAKPDAPLLYRLNANAEQWRFIWRFLRECTAKRADDNLKQMVNLGLYSRATFKALMDELPMNFEQRLQGIMHFYTSPDEYQAAVAPTQRMQTLGCHRTLITPATARTIEPALSVLGDALVGATHTDADFSANAHLFTNELAKHCQEHGVRFVYDTHIDRIGFDGTHITHLELSKNNHSFTHTSEHYVVCLASFGKRLLDPLGVHLPIFPAKGYSATYAVRDGKRVPQVSLIDDEYKLVMSRFSSEKRDVLRVAGTAEFNGYNTQLDQTRCQAITHRVQTLFGDALDYDEPNYWTGLRPMTPSNVPLIGRAYLGKIWHGQTATPNRKFDNLWLNTGHGTLGLTHSCGSAKALSLLMAGQTPPIDFAFIGA
ncbi:D-amino acid dehydrogenase [Moraxella nasibovis]|uniref:D-amino acid dehydrogenase n=1 Tax=Moraxella nasibovis TaxID=2904120 RepID=UPI00240EA051|nr:D-amino acid dehydrogenase [Moraxella nasibovis]WFF38426.1 D-amino acid dehydrogenase [Moraxella nasibovis]